MQRLKELRIEKKMTQAELALIIGVNQTGVGKYERGELEPNLDTLKKFADYFECSIDYLVGRSDDLGNVTVSGTFGERLNDEEKEMLLNYRQLNKANRLRAEAYILVRLENQP